MPLYDEMADFYDLVYPDRGDRDFYLKEARKARGRILEVACGTGRILIPLLKAGFDACGLDISPEMLERLRKKALQEGIVPRLFLGDMRDFSLDGKFGLIIVPFRSFHHLNNASERLEALRNFRRHLDSGGRLILHLTVPPARERALTKKFHRAGSEKISGGKVGWEVRFDDGNDSADYRITLATDSGKTRSFSMTLHFFPIAEIASSLKSIGFKNVNVYCGFGYSPFNEGCEEAVVVADS
ncbi:MAG TPA: class I SAM-dependent methyltransferase [Candidatus Bilamarchaeum sp.]|nr:class I SAM-dependent methyltransferase [Candidatus Bilamarchaeum sp.]